MKRFIKYLFLLVLSSLFLINIISHASLHFLRKSTFYKPSFLVNQVNDNSFDYLVLGASTGLTTLNTRVIDSISGLTGINLSIDDTGIPNHYLMLQHFLAEGKTVKYCILVPSLAGIDNSKNQIGDNDYRFLMYVNRPYITNYYKSLEPKSTINVLYLSTWVPFLGVSYYNTELLFPSLLSVVKPNRRNRFDNFGNYTYPVNNSNLKASTKTIKTIGFKNPYLKKMEDLCKMNQIELIYYLPPNRIVTPSLLGANKNIIDHTNRLKDDLYFYDDIHVNSLGNKKASVFFSKDFLKYHHSFLPN